MSFALRPPCFSALGTSRQRAVVNRCARPSSAPRKSAPPCAALRRELEPVSFADVYLAMQERVATQGTLPKGDGRLMVESIRSVEHAQRTLQLIARHVATKREQAGALELDWPIRKKWLERICEHALRLPNAKPLILDIFSNVEVFGLSTYFAADMVETLGKRGVEVALLVRIVELFRSRRPPGDKGAAAAYHRLLAVVRERKDEAATKAASAALKKILAEQQPAAAATETVAAPVAAVPVAAAPVAAAPSA